ncbi:hypothetical protein [Candidatus Methylomirabilis sp.]|uniref:hypothetical protein n=1 Tax=Candidatus Methylomirabilis sp. TaxID=2032687 RepID=UPI003C719D5A
MIDFDVLGVKELGDLFAHLSVQEIAAIGLLILSLVSLSLLWVLLRRRLKGATVEPVVSGVEVPEVSTQAASEVAAVQVELREMIREFSSVAEQVLRALDRDQVMAKLPDAGRAALQLLDLGLTPTETARATGMAMGEVALLINLHRMKAVKGGLAATLPTETGGLSDHARSGNGRSGHATIEVAGT